MLRKLIKKNKKIKEVIPYGKHYIDEKDISEVIKTLKSSNLTQGPKIEELEKYVHMLDVNMQ